MGTAVLTLIGSVLDSRLIQWSHDRSFVADLRREAVRWVNRCTDLPNSLNTFEHEHILTQSLHYWISAVETIPAEKVFLRKVLLWIARAQLDSVCIGVVTITKDASSLLTSQKISKKPQAIEIRFDRSVETVKLLPAICELLSTVRDSPIVGVLSDSLRDAARIANLNDVLAALLGAADRFERAVTVAGALRGAVGGGGGTEEAVGGGGTLGSVGTVGGGDLSETISAGDGNGITSIESARSSLAEIVQSVLISLVHTHEEAMRNRIMQARRYDSPGQIDMWEEQMELLVYEPGLWSSLLAWGTAPAYASSRGTTDHSKGLKKFVDRTSDLLRSVSASALSGHLSVDAMKRVVSVSSGDAVLRAGWLAIESPLGESSLIAALDAEMNSAFAEVTALKEVGILIDRNVSTHMIMSRL